MIAAVRYAACMLLLLASLPFHRDAQAQETGRKLALVIGNSSYKTAGSLPNASRDAKAFNTFLIANGFESTLLLDGDRTAMTSALSKFVRQIGPQDAALFYYAGHGMQLKGENYLLATEAKLASEFDVAGETLALSDIMGAIERRAKIALLFLDACRNNPLAQRLNDEVEGKSRSLATRGLAPIKSSGAGTMVAFAAAPGEVAFDGTGENSPFTKALVDNLAKPGLEVGTAFNASSGRCDQKRTIANHRSCCHRWHWSSILALPPNHRPRHLTSWPTSISARRSASRRRVPGNSFSPSTLQVNRPIWRVRPCCSWKERLLRAGYHRRTPKSA
ncbi:caspase family protein [Pararhizobium sp.]|uniref:caspase family protein n=1 Tax=Pararhizobium sp. TaxID=1977563 RepID=UPI002728702A|nr:caspase family protein [Pararhizobium sp.]MDO9415803.1 caspase family protein [Pararhizobium sp.]